MNINNTSHLRTRPSARGSVLGSAVLLAAMGALAGCGGSSTTATTARPAPAATTAASAPPTATAPAAHIRARGSALGRILVDASGRTLYVFSADRAARSVCTPACLRFWPAETTGGAPTAGPGVTASMLGTTRGAGGVTLVTYHGHPLYRFARDVRPGQIRGEGRRGFGGRWTVISPAGAPVEPRPHPRPAASAPPARAATTAPPPATTQSPATTSTHTASPTQAHTVSPPVTSTTRSRTAAPPAPSGGIPQNNGGDQDADNNGGPSDGDGNV